MYKRILVSLIVCQGIFFCLGCSDTNDQMDDHGEQESHEQHGHVSHEDESEEVHAEHADEAGHENHEENRDEHEDQSGHEGHEEEGEEQSGHDDHSGHEGHDEEGPEVELSAKGVELAELTLDTVRSGKITKVIELPGEVGFNEDKVAHVVPRFSGIVNKAYRKLGDYVKAGETLASIESNESLSEYLVTSRISGRVIEKHATLGEFVSSESPIYVIADLASVWVSLAVYVKDAQNIRIGQPVTIESIGNEQKVTGKISYLSNVYNENTRNMTARVVLPNRNHSWKPGTFVRGMVKLKSNESSMSVSEQAIQIIDEKMCVFVPVKGEENTFKPVEVQVGERDGNNAHILSGLNLGDTYVSNGAYELKSKIVTGSLGDHAGHGH